MDGQVWLQPCDAVLSKRRGPSAPSSLAWRADYAVSLERDLLQLGLQLATTVASRRICRFRWEETGSGHSLRESTRAQPVRGAGPSGAMTAQARAYQGSRNLSFGRQTSRCATRLHSDW